MKVFCAECESELLVFRRAWWEPLWQKCVVAPCDCCLANEREHTQQDAYDRGRESVYNEHPLLGYRERDY